MNTYVKFTFIRGRQEPGAGQTDTVDFVVCAQHESEIAKEHNYYATHANVASVTRPHEIPTNRPCTFCPKEAK